MSATAPAQIWWTAAEIAAEALPDMPATRQGVNTLSERMSWRSDPQHAQRRTGRGGGWEYHWKLFPLAAQKKLLAEVAPHRIQPAPMARVDAWAWFDALPDTVKEKAQSRLKCIQMVEALVLAGTTKFLAVSEVAKMSGISDKTLWNWFLLIEGVRADDRLPHLSPRHRAAVRKANTHASFSLEFRDILWSDFLRPAAPSFSSCYRRAVRVAENKGWDIAPDRTMRRRLHTEISKPSQVLARKGIDALKAMYPSQTRDKTALHAMEVVNADFHKFDVFVRWPAERNSNECIVTRPQMVAFQDIHSGRILSWRVDQTPNAQAVKLCTGDMIEAYGIPEHIVLDNGREFAAKALTGGTPTRYRFKVREDDLPGLFVTLGCEVHWATPYSGQSKPIERAFRDMCDNIAKDPRFDGAYTGNRPDAKPEDYGSRAIDLEQFLTVLAEGIEEHNTRVGRRSEVAWGRSFAEVFDTSYASAPIRKATEEQRRLWLLGAEDLRANRTTGLVKFQKNEYWADWMQGIAGERVIVRFDPADLFGGLHIYSADNAYLGHAPCKLKAGFLDMEEAKAHSKARKTWLNAEKVALAAHRKLKAAEIGTELDAIALPASEPVEAKVVRPVFAKPAKPVAAPQGPDLAKAQAAIVADLAAHRDPVDTDELPRERFQRALELERALEAGKPATADQQRWLSVYQSQPEYTAERILWEDFGDAYFG
ncbi:transposase domain-containing protein [Profundibacter sp.]